MLRKMYRKFNELSYKQLKKVFVVSLIVAIVLLALGFTGVNEYFLIPPVVIAFFIFTISGLNLGLIYEKNKSQAENEAELEKLKQELSEEVYTEVLFLPELTKYCYNSPIAYEDESLKRAAQLLRDLRVRHFAKLSNGKIILMAKDKDGNCIGDPIVLRNVKSFYKNYQIFN